MCSGSLGIIALSCTQVENLKAVHPDYGNSVQTLLDKYNADAQKVNTVLVNIILSKLLIFPLAWLCSQSLMLASKC